MQYGFDMTRIKMFQYVSPALPTKSASDAGLWVVRRFPLMKWTGIYYRPREPMLLTDIVSAVKGSSPAGSFFALEPGRVVSWTIHR